MHVRNTKELVHRAVFEDLDQLAADHRSVRKAAKRTQGKPVFPLFPNQAHRQAEPSDHVVDLRSRFRPDLAWRGDLEAYPGWSDAAQIARVL